MNVEEILTSIGASSGLFLFYKAAKAIYYKYYINSECHNISDTATKIEITISKDEHQEHDQEHKQEHHEEHKQENKQKEEKKI